MRAVLISLAHMRWHDEPKPWIMILLGRVALNGDEAMVDALA